MDAPSPDTAAQVAEILPVAVTLETRRGARTLSGAPGETLLSALRHAAAPIRSVCGGAASCGTCRITPAPPWRTRLDPPGRTEARLLSVLEEAGPHDRLACQIVLSSDLDGLVVRVGEPKAALAASAAFTPAQGDSP